MVKFDMENASVKILTFSQWVLCLVFLLTSLIQLTSPANSDETHSTHSNHNHSGHHSTLDVLKEKIPSVELKISEDKVSGWNITLLTDNFSFTPESVNEQATQNQGHAHIYINDIKIARLYSPYFHLGALPTGEHEIRVTLNADDHSAFVFNNKPIEAVTHISVPAH